MKKSLAMAAGIILMAVGIIASFASYRLRWGYLYIPAAAPALLGWQLYRWGKQQ